MDKTPKPLNKPLIYTAWLRWLSFAVVSLVALYFSAFNSSPINDVMGGDYGIFRVMGALTLDSGVIFRDLFDNKGPYHFFIQTLGLWISADKWGIFLIEALALTISLEILYRCGKRLGASALQCVCAEAVFLAFYIFTVFDGDKSEEFAMPMIAGSIYLGIKYIQAPSERRAILYSGCIGLCLSIIAFMKLSIDCLIVGVVLGVLYYMICSRQYIRILKCTGALCLGIIIGAAPAIIYFSIHGVLDEMIYGTFTYNMLYVDHWLNITPRHYVVNGARMTVCVLLPVATYFYDRRNHTHLLPLMIAMSIMPPLVYLRGPVYIYYYIAITPLVFLLFILLRQFKWWVWGVAVLLIAGPPALVGDWYALVRLIYWQHITDEPQWPQGQELYNTAFKAIPPEELDSVYLLEVNGQYTDLLLQSGHHPVGKYFTHQLLTAGVDQRAEQDILKQFDAANPRWIISSAHMHETMFGEPFGNRYTIVDSSLIRNKTATDSMMFYVMRRRDSKPLECIGQ